MWLHKYSSDVRVCMMNKDVYMMNKHHWQYLLVTGAADLQYVSGCSKSSLAFLNYRQCVFLRASSTAMCNDIYIDNASLVHQQRLSCCRS